MAKFDPARHRVVAVPYLDDDPERGQHFHVSLDALIDAAREAHQSTEIVPVDDDRMGFVVKRLNAIEARLTELESRPYLSPEDIRQLGDGLNTKIKGMIEKHVNSALGDVRSRLVTVERNTTTNTAGEPQSAQLAKLAEMVRNFGELVQTVERDFDGRIAHVEQMYAEVAQHISDTNLKTLQLSTRLYRALQALESDADAA